MSVTVTRALAGAVALTVATIGGPAGAAPSGGTAEAAPAEVIAEVGAQNQFATTSTCYGGSVRSFFQVAGWGGSAGPYRASTRCKDVNVRNASPFPVDACVVFVDKTSKCNYWTYLPAKSGWVVVATNVKDGVRFQVRFETQRYEYEALTSHHAF
ncbi:hypothetical protein ABT336_15225 [Micromonospora sp. NPDC000207]|uniref:hypothetical protein n=1 Tax=Micromonospora sp. NPDC000207 TaxID=3154246 RepID=UPI003320DEC1